MSSSRGMQRLCSVTASTQRANNLAGGAPAIYLTGVKCTPLDPQADITAAGALNRQTGERDPGTSHSFLHTYVLGILDILIGDVLVVAGVGYPVREVHSISGTIGDCMYVRVEDFSRYA